MNNPKIKAIAFYLPQFHPIPENDEWWGTGFTEWRNVAKAKPQFPGHYQPHIPADLGFYDLRLSETREAQAELAKKHGIHGFCYYHYWFNGRRILERPFAEVLESGKPDFPFCLCWANENWTRIWDGGDKNILLEQKYSSDDDLAHIKSLFPAFRDSRYIRIDGKPLFLVYRAELIPHPKETVETWQKAAIEAGIGELYIARVESHESSIKNISPISLGFNADVEFSPFSWRMGNVKFQSKTHRFLAKVGLLSKGFINNRIIDYDSMVSGMLSRPAVDWKRFYCVTPSWDNSARRNNASIFTGSTPEKYEKWLTTVAKRTRNNKSPNDEKIIFINAWNEWAEGNHLEPDLKWGNSYLEATTNGLNNFKYKKEVNSNFNKKNRKQSSIKRMYWHIISFLRRQLDLLKVIGR